MSKSIPVLLIFIILLVQFSSGINYVTIPLSLDNQGINNLFIGVAMAFEIVAVALLYSQLSNLIQRFGIAISLIVITSVRVMSLLWMGHNEHYIGWLAGIFFYGAATGMLIVLVQTLLNVSVTGSAKGVFMGLFSSALSSGVALGPLLLHLFDIPFQQRLNVNAALVLLPSLGLAFCVSNASRIFETVGHIRVKFVWRHARTVFISVVVCGVAFYGLPNFLTIYGLENGLNDQQAPFLMTMFMLGSVFLGMLFSYASTVFDRQIVVLSCVFGSVVCAVYLSLSLYASYSVSLVLLFIWGGCMGGVYAIGLSVVGDRFHRHDQVSVNACYTLMDAIGGILGLVIIGISMDVWGVEGMTYVYVTMGCAYLTFFVYQMGKQDPVFH